MDLIFLDDPYHRELLRGCHSEETCASKLYRITSSESSFQVVLETCFHPSCEEQTLIVSTWIGEILQGSYQTEYITVQPTPCQRSFRLRYIAHKSHLNWDEIVGASGFIDPHAYVNEWPSSLDVEVISPMVQRLLPKTLFGMHGSLIALEVFDLTMVMLVLGIVKVTFSRYLRSYLRTRWLNLPPYLHWIVLTLLEYLSHYHQKNFMMILKALMTFSCCRALSPLMKRLSPP